ncbi:hypothetical protein NQZ68_018139 [Dissostichus eleginoides]|nr:hypothetical protein NQZ68_018139 [Dissostichus eleginoides]
MSDYSADAAGHRRHLMTHLGTLGIFVVMRHDVPPAAGTLPVLRSAGTTWVKIRSAGTAYRCKHNIQYLHQPLNNTDDTADAFVADDDTLVISGGLYDGHPIYDNVPEAPAADRSQFRLQFLH